MLYLDCVPYRRVSLRRPPTQRLPSTLYHHYYIIIIYILSLSHLLSIYLFIPFYFIYLLFIFITSSLSSPIALQLTTTLRPPINSAASSRSQLRTQDTHQTLRHPDTQTLTNLLYILIQLHTSPPTSTLDTPSLTAALHDHLGFPPFYSGTG